MSLINKKFCKNCFESDDGICSICSLEIGICLNCISYGNGGLCTNCLTMGDEGICLEHDLAMILEWIVDNDSFFTFLDVV